MNQVATRPDNGGMSVTQVGIGSSHGAKLAPQSLAEVVRFAEVMCKADIALPKHLRGNPGACMAVALQALEWDMSPFAVASKSYAVNGQIAYEAQLIVAVINTRSGIEGRLKYRFEGEGDERVCIAFGKLDGEVLEVQSPPFGKITPKNSPLWKSDPDQQQCYYTGRAWGRRYTPEVMLGVYDREEAADMRDITPAPQQTLADRFAPRKPEQAPAVQEGFSLSHVQEHTRHAPQDGEWNEAPEEGAAPSDDAPLQSEEAQEQVTGGQAEPEQEDAQAEAAAAPLAEYGEALNACRTPAEVEALTPKFAEAINALSKEDKRRAKEMRLARAKETEGGQA